jgi:hypothetical protein
MAAPHTSAKAQDDNPLRPLKRGRNYAMPKGHCTSRSEWRVLPGKPPERLSPYYQLACEFGSSLMLSWRSEGSEPVYVCEEHAKELEHSAPVRESASSPSSEAGKNNKKETSIGAEPVAVPEKASSGAPKAVNSTPEADRKITKSARPSVERSAAINQLISDLATQLERIFSQSEATIRVVDAIDFPLEQATLGIIGNLSMTETQKDAAVQELGALQESLKQGASQDITPLEAHRIKQAVENSLKGEVTVVEEAKPGYRAVCVSLENATHAAVPKAKHLEERLANLLKMKAELEDFPKVKEPAPVVA